jgi:outer membrane biosynthesis protein TonB
MSKNISLKDASHDQLLDELKNRLAAGGEGDGGEETEFPTVEQIDEMDEEAINELAEKVGFDTDENDTKTLKKFLKTVNYAMTGSDELDAKQLKDVLAALGLKAVKDNDANIETLNNYLNEDGSEESEDEEDSDEEESEEESEDESEEEESEDEDADEESEDEEEEEKPKAKKKKKADDDDEDEAEEESEESDEEESEDEEEADDESEEEESEDEDESEESESEVDAAAVAKAAKLPKEEIMVKRLAAFNKVAGKKAIDVKKSGGTQKAYRKLLELLVDDGGELADWGAAYVKDGEGWCCGVKMKDHKIKGDKQDYGKCVVSGKLFFINDESEFEEKEAD